MRKIPNFVLVRSFEAAARLESFVAASAELNVTPSAVSHQVRELEAFVGLALFERSGRGVRLTSAGSRLRTSFARILDELEIACEDAKGPVGEQTLRVHCSPSFAVKWLGPRLRNLCREHPDVSIKVMSSSGGIDLLDRPDVDVAISYARVAQRPGLQVTGLGRESIEPLCSPALRADYPDARAMMQRATLIESQLSPVTWRRWFSENGLVHNDRDRLSFDRATLSIAAAVDSMGVALESTRLAQRELASGELVTLKDPAYSRVREEIHFLSMRMNERHLEKVSRFAAWLKRELALEPVASAAGA